MTTFAVLVDFVGASCNELSFNYCMIMAKIVIAITLSIQDIQLLSISSLSFDFHFQISMVQP